MKAAISDRRQNQCIQDSFKLNKKGELKSRNIVMLLPFFGLQRILYQIDVLKNYHFTLKIIYFGW